MGINCRKSFNKQFGTRDANHEGFIFVIYFKKSDKCLKHADRHDERMNLIYKM